MWSLCFDAPDCCTKVISRSGRAQTISKFSPVSHSTVDQGVHEAACYPWVCQRVFVKSAMLTVHRRCLMFQPMFIHCVICTRKSMVVALAAEAVFSLAVRGALPSSAHTVVVEDPLATLAVTPTFPPAPYEPSV